MSNFYCDKCGKAVTENSKGVYVTGCEHYPTDKTIAAINALPDGLAIMTAQHRWGVGPKTDVCSVNALKALITELTELRQNIYGNTKGYGRRAFWTEAGWEIEAHRDDPEDGYYADDALAAVRLIGVTVRVCGFGGG